MKSMNHIGDKIWGIKNNNWEGKKKEKRKKKVESSFSNSMTYKSTHR